LRFFSRRLASLELELDEESEDDEEEARPMVA
jgi:hypothetical protein